MDRNRPKWTEIDQSVPKWTEFNHSRPNWTERTEVDQNGVNGPKWTKWSTVDPTGTNTLARNRSKSSVLLFLLHSILHQ